MSESVRCWMVERAMNDKGLVELVYATPDGERAYRRHRSQASVVRSPVTAAKDVDADQLEPVEDEATRERYAREVERTTEQYAPDDEI